MVATNAHACQDITVGADHRALGIHFKLTKHKKKQSIGKKTNGIARLWGWRPTDQHQYIHAINNKLEGMVDDNWLHQGLEKRCRDIEEIVKASAIQLAVVEKQWAEEKAQLNQKMRELIDVRKRARNERNKEEVKEASKQIQKEVKAVTTARKRGKISAILSEFRGLKQVANIQSGGKQTSIASVKDTAGKLQTNRQDVADAFAEFYALLYKCCDPLECDDNHGRLDCAPVSAVTRDEVRHYLKKMSKKKDSDTCGIVVECLQEGGEWLASVLAEFFTDVLKGDAQVPEYWKETRLKVLIKKGDSQLAENYRPISVLPILYKCFSKLVCGRIRDTLERAQSRDQAVFRAGFSCDDHLFAIMMVTDRHREYNRPLWVAAVDFKKAFDTIGHTSLWEALREHGVPVAYISCLMKLYDGQSGTVQCDRLSRAFPIQRETKQGDPISPILFNAARAGKGNAGDQAEMVEEKMGHTNGLCHQGLSDQFAFRRRHTIGWQLTQTNNGDVR